MGKCVNQSHPEFKTLLESAGDISSSVLAAKIGVWMDKNNTDSLPSLSELGIKAKSVQQRTIANPKISQKTLKQLLGISKNKEITDSKKASIQSRI